MYFRVQASELVANLFQECDSTKIDYHGLCKYAMIILVPISSLRHTPPSPNAMWENVFLLLLTAAIKILLTAWTFGMMVSLLRPAFSDIYTGL